MNCEYVYSLFSCTIIVVISKLSCSTNAVSVFFFYSEFCTLKNLLKSKINVELFFFKGKHALYTPFLGLFIFVIICNSVIIFGMNTG